MAPIERDLTGEVLDGKYRLTRLLGRGGMGSVYEAAHTMINRRVAVKLLHAELSANEQMAERFLREARSASAIEHPGIIEILDVGRADDGAMFIVMELLEGVSLNDEMKRHARVPATKALDIARQILDGLQAAHDRGIVHRDLKPDNIFLVPNATGHTVKLLDFGISKVQDGDDIALTKTGTVMGTPHYMAPEQARGQSDVDHRIDLWAAGVIVYQMLSGALPCPGDSYNQVLARILVDPIRPLDEIVTGISPALSSAIGKALKKDREERFNSAAEMAAALQNAAADLEDMVALDTLVAPADALDAATQPYARAATGRDRITQPGTAMADTMAADSVDAEIALADTALPVEMADTMAADAVTADTDVAEPLLAQTGVAQDEPPSSAPLEDGPVADASGRKAIAWHVLTLLPSVLMPLLCLVSTDMRTATLTMFGDSAALGMLFVVVATALAVWGSRAGLRFWRAGVASPLLHGNGFVVFPVVGLLLVFYRHTVLSTRIETALMSFSTYADVTTVQAGATTQRLITAWAEHINVTAAILITVTWLAVLAVLSHVFAAHGAREQRMEADRRWWVWPIGLAVIALGHAVLSLWLTPPPLPWSVPVYGIWLLACAPLVWRPVEESDSGGWRVILAATIGMKALVGVALCLGFIQMFASLATTGADDRIVMWRSASVFVQDAGAVWGVVGTALLVVQAVVCRRALPLSGRLVTRHARDIGIALATLFATGTPGGLLLEADRNLTTAVEMPSYKPALVEMSPVASKPDGPPDVYLDRTPASLDRSRADFYVRLTGGRRDDYTEARLLAALEGPGECAQTLAGLVGAKDNKRPANCLTAIEARLYCEARGKRLQTPDEWRAAFKDGAPVADAALVDKGPPQRTNRSEWAMRMQHGSPVFEIVGATAEKGHSPPPTTRSADITFRCAFTMPSASQDR